MKKILPLIIFLFSITVQYSFAQSKKYAKMEESIKKEFAEMQEHFTTEDYTWSFVEILEEPLSKDELYTSLLTVLAEVYNDSKEVVQVADKEAGLIVAKGCSTSDYRNDNWATVSQNRCWHFITVNIKEGRLRITLKITGIERIQGTSLYGVSFTGDELSLDNFYPYWTDCKPKMREISFANLRYAYNSATAVISMIKDKLSAMADNASDDW